MCQSRKMKILLPGIKLGVLPNICLLQRCGNATQASVPLLSTCAFSLQADGSPALRAGLVLLERGTGTHRPALLRLGCGQPQCRPGPSEKQGQDPKAGRGVAADSPRGTKLTLLWLAVGWQLRGPTFRRVSGWTVHRLSASGSSAVGDACLRTHGRLPAAAPQGHVSLALSALGGRTALPSALALVPGPRKLSSAQPGSEGQPVNSRSHDHAPSCGRLLAVPQRDQARRHRRLPFSLVIWSRGKTWGPNPHQPQLLQVLCDINN